jgi:hypothetical protein
MLKAPEASMLGQTEINKKQKRRVLDEPIVYPESFRRVIPS